MTTKVQVSCRSCRSCRHFAEYDSSTEKGSPSSKLHGKVPPGLFLVMASVFLFIR